MYSAMASWEQDDSGAETSISRGNRHAHKNGGRRVVLVANNPRSYREAISTVLQELCADCEVTAVEPEALDLQVDRTSPEVVICNRATFFVKEKVFAWVELYPDGEQLAVISIGGRRSTIPEIQLNDLLSFVDRSVNRAWA